MRKIYLVIPLLLVSVNLFSQTNIFPASGNVGIGTLYPRTPIHSIGHYNMIQLRLERSGSHVGYCDLGGSNGDFRVWSGGYDKNHRFIVRGDNGNVGIGTLTPAYKLDVLGTIRARELKVDMQGADFVFEENYPLRPISELEDFVKTNKHLPEIATAKEMQANGVNQSEMNQRLLQKIEELTLYLIDQNKLIKSQTVEMMKMEKVNAQQSEVLKKQQEQLNLLIKN